MRSFVIACFAILMCFAPADRVLFAQGRQICCMSTGESLNQVIERNRYCFLARRTGSEPSVVDGKVIESEQVTTFEITEVIKKPDGATIQIAQKLTITELNSPTTRETASDNKLLHKQLGSSAIIVSNNDDFKTDTDVLYEAVPEVVAYLKETRLALAGSTSEVDRRPLFMKYITHKSPDVASDAMSEVMAGGFESLWTIRDELPREAIMTKLIDPATPDIQIGNYAILAGMCGTDADARLLKTMAFNNDADFRVGANGLMAGYLLLTGEDGLAVLEASRLQATKVRKSDGTEITLPFSEIYAAMEALRFHWDVEPTRIPKHRLMQSMRLLLDRPELADLVITDLRQWKDWSLHDRLMQMYDEQSIPATRRAIIRYMLYSSAEPDVVGPDGKPSRPEHALKADELLKQLEAKDPKTVKDAKRFMPESTR